MRPTPCVALPLLIFAEARAGDIIYAADTLNDRIVTIDVDTGQTEVLLEVERDLRDTDMAALGGLIYVYDFHFPTDAALVTIHPGAGQVLSIVPVTLNGAPAGGESMTEWDGRLLVAVLGQDAGSNALGFVDESGAVSGVVNFANADFDGLGTSPALGIIAADSTGNPERADMYRVAIDPPSVTGFGPQLSFRVHDIAFVNGRMFGAANVIGVIAELDPATGAPIRNITPSLPGNYIGITGPAPCAADFNGDGNVNLFDFLAFQTAYGNDSPAADLAPPFGVLNLFDFLAFQTAFGNGC